MPPDEALKALGRLAVGKAGGHNGLLPDILKRCGGFYCIISSHCFELFERKGVYPQSGEIPDGSCAEERRLDLL